MNNSCVCFTCKDARMALLKGRHSLLRYLGFIAAIFACLQAMIWIGMYLSGIICFYTKCGSRQPANKFGKSFYNIYLNTKLSSYYPHMVTPILLHVFMWFCMLLMAVWLYFSVILIVDYYKWNKAKRLRKSSKRWIIVTIIVCAVDLLLFLLFVVDFSRLKSGMIGASVRSMDYDDTDRHGSPFDDSVDYDTYPSNRNMFTDPSIVLDDPVLIDDPAKVPELTFDERINLIKQKLANKHSEIDAIIKELTDKAAMIVDTESGTYYNPMAQMRTAELKQQLIDVEKLYLKPIRPQTEIPPVENKDNSGVDKESKETSLPDIRKWRRSIKRNLEETGVYAIDKSNNSAVDKKSSTADKAASDKEDNKERSSADSRKWRRSIKIGNLEETEEEIDKSNYDAKEERTSFKIGQNFSREGEAQNSKEGYDKKNKTRNFDTNTNSSSKFGGKPVEEINDELKNKKKVKNKFNLKGNSGHLSAKEEYDIVWRSMFDNDGFGIILQNPGGIGLRRAMDEGTGGMDMVLAPSALLMTLAIRGYIVWVFNLTAALMVMYLYITRPRRPTLITRVQA